MFIKSSAFIDGDIDDRYGGRGGVFIGPMSTPSFPFEICEAPSGTITFAVIFDDPDAVGPQGFVWIHWLVSGLKKTSLPENASRTDVELVQGVTSWYPRRLDDQLASCFYGGPNPPDKPHVYSFRVYALDYDPGLKTGFTLDELLTAIEGHCLDSAELRGRYLPKSA